MIGRARRRGEQIGQPRPICASDACGQRRAIGCRAPDAAPVAVVAGRVEHRRRQLELHGARAAGPHLAERQPHHLGDARPLEDRVRPTSRPA